MRYWWIAAVIAGAVILVVYSIYDPAVAPMPECPFFRITGLYCPGCGSQRALHAMLNGHVTAMLGFNVLLPAAMIFFVAEGVTGLLRRSGRQMQTLSSRRYMPVAVLIVVVTFWVLRNIPAWPFTLLAP